MRHLPVFLRVAALLVLAAWMLVPGALHAQYFRFGKNKVQYETHRWQYVQSQHFDVYFYEGGEYLADFTAKAAEDAYAQIRDLFQHEIADRIAETSIEELCELSRELIRRNARLEVPPKPPLRPSTRGAVKNEFPA